jgi:hypothetical protein
MSNKSYVKAILKMSQEELLAVCINNSEYLSDGYYREFGHAILARWEQIKNDSKKDQRAKEAHVICMNDSPMHVVIGSPEDAEKILLKLQKAYYDKNKGCGRWESFDFYKNCIFWYIRDVECSFGLID